MKVSHQGFTLLELMIALTLGLILVAVAVQLLVSSQGNYRIQQAASVIQDSGVFSLNAVTKNIRIANHGNAGLLDDEASYSGIVLTAQSAGKRDEQTLGGNLTGLKIGSTDVDGEDYVSRSSSHQGAITEKSDQLVIMYQAPRDMTTCTGRPVKGPTKSFSDTTGTLTLSKGWYVIERYYIKKDGKNSHLYCSDARFIADTKDAPSTYQKNTLSSARVLDKDYVTQAGQMIAKNVDYMKVQLIVRHELLKKKADGTQEFVTNNVDTMDLSEFEDYKKAAYQKLAAIDKKDSPKLLVGIVGVNLAWLVKSDSTIKNVERVKYPVMGQDITVADDKFMRHVYSTTIALRNGGLGELEK